MIKCYAATILLLTSLTGCAMSPDEVALENKKLELMEKIALQPTVKCEHGCEYTDPQKNLNLFPSKTNGWDFATTVLNTATEVSPWVAVTKIAVDGIKNAGNNTTNTDSNNETGGNTTSGDVDSSVTSGDVITSGDTTTETAGNDLIKAGNDLNQNPTETTTTTTTTDSNDNNSTVDSNDNNSVTNPATTTTTGAGTGL